MEVDTVGFFLNERSRCSIFQMIPNKARGNDTGRDNLEEKKFATNSKKFVILTTEVSTVQI